MYKAKERVGRVDDPLVIEISQFLDLKLNQQGDLIKSHRWENGGMNMTKKKLLKKTVMKTIKEHIKEQEKQQLQWQKSVIREEHISFK